MILIDLSQVAISSAMANNVTEINMLRHLVLFQISALKKKFKKYSNEVVLCVDSAPYWRREKFPLYKKHRQKNKDASSFDWNTFYAGFNQLIEEFKENTPYKVLAVSTAEADDIISVMTRTYSVHDDVIIVSTDHDFIQLHNSRVKQYDNRQKKFITSDGATYDLFEHIVKGDGGDGIPNIITDDDVFMVEGKRSKPIRATTLETWKNQAPEDFCNSIEMLEKFNRNRLLIDLTLIPEELAISIKDCYNSLKSNGHNTFNYLIKHKLARIMEDGGL